MYYFVVAIACCSGKSPIQLMAFSQRAHDVIMTSYQRCACWVMSCLGASFDSDTPRPFCLNILIYVFPVRPNFSQHLVSSTLIINVLMSCQSSAWPIHYLINDFAVLKGTQLYFLLSITCQLYFRGGGGGRLSLSCPL